MLTRRACLAAAAATPLLTAVPVAAATEVKAAQDAMRRATRFMTDKAATKGGYVWSYLPDFSRRWGEMEAWPGMIWTQAPGTPEMGQIFLDAWRATGEAQYLEAAVAAGDALIRGQRPDGDLDRGLYQQHGSADRPCARGEVGMNRSLILAGVLAVFATGAAAQEHAPDGRAYRAQPLTTELFIADPSAHVFDGRIYVYGSHDIQGPPADDQPGKGFVMKDYVVLSMERIGGPVTVHPTALTLAAVPWADRQLWAPDAAYKDGRYYLYFPAKDRDGVFRIGVATGERPEGPFTPEPLPMPGAYSIDPSVFVDEDGAAYLYVGGIHGGQLQRWASGRYDPAAGDTDLNQPGAASLMPKVARLSDNMLTLAEPVRDAVILDEHGQPLKGGDLDRRFFEAAWLHRYNGLYYLSYSTGDTHFIAYATATTPYGPFTHRGRVLLPVQGWTTHHSIVEVEGQWRLFYHDTQMSNRTHLRSAKVVDLHHEADGAIRTIDPFIPAH